MFNKLFKRKSVPENDGKSSVSKVDKLNYVKVYELELSNMEDTPVYTLTNQLSIGSEIGNIIIADPSVSPRHASFILQEDVVSVIDHGSVAGTFINGKKITPGKYVILEESDIVLVGDLEVKLRAGRAAVKATEEEVLSEEEEELPPPPVSENLELEKKEEIEEEPVPPTKQYYTPPSSKKAEPLKPNPKPQKKKPLTISAPQPAANALVRVLSIVSDLLLSYGILIILSPFDEFKEFVKDVPVILGSVIEVDWNLIWSMIREDYGFVVEMLQDVYSFLSNLFDFLPLLLVFAFLRLLTTLLFGVTISELFLGMRAAGNGIWKRLGGVIRVLLGFVTWPFIIFDLPSLLSRRTFKEIVTFTHKINPSKFLTILGVLIYIPLILAFVVVSPLFQGLEAPEPILISDRIDQRVKARVPVEPKPEIPEEAPAESAADAPIETSTNTPPAGAGTEVSPETTPLMVEGMSDRMKLKVSYNPDELRVFPDFKFKGVQSKLNVAPSLIFYQRDLQRPVELEIFKFFDMKQLLGIGLKGNIFLHDKYPNLYNFVYEASENPAFKKKLSGSDQLAFANEFIQFTKSAFGLSLDSAPEIMQTETPLIKSLVDFKASFLSLIEYKEFDDIGFAKIGSSIFLRISYLKQKPFDLLIPLVRGQGRIFKVTFDKKEGFKSAQSRFYKYNLNESEWMPEAKDLTPGSLSGLEVYDLFSEENYKGLFSSSDLAQSLYAYYFETSTDVMKKADPVEIEVWKDKVSTMLKLLEELPSPELAEGQEDMKSKLMQNFRDMQDALGNNNAEYFGISTTTAI